MVWWNKQSENPEERRMKAEHAKENLFLLLDDKMANHVGKLDFWRDLHALDDCIVPGSIRVRPHCQQSPGESEDMPLPEVVIGLSDAEKVRRAQHKLNKIFEGSGAKFEMATHPTTVGAQTELIGHLDKHYWDKLALFCQYRFEREVPAEARDELKRSCQKQVEAYTAGTPYADWQSAPGVPAFVTLMGLPGVLRAHTRELPDAKRKQAEFNSPHKRGVPYLFEAVPVHVTLKSARAREIDPTPYDYGYDPEREALESATQGKDYLEILADQFGGNLFRKGANWTERGRTAVSYTIWGFGLDQLSGWIGPIATVVCAGGFVGVTYVDHKYKLLHRLQSAFEKKQMMEALAQEQSHVPACNAPELLIVKMENLQKALEAAKASSAVCPPPLPLVEQVERMKTLGRQGDSLAL